MCARWFRDAEIGVHGSLAFYFLYVVEKINEGFVFRACFLECLYFTVTSYTHDWRLYTHMI